MEVDSIKVVIQSSRIAPQYHLTFSTKHPPMLALLGFSKNCFGILKMYE